MNYKVLYRKYRPTNFENIIGQEYIVKTLKNSIINNNISHAYIFSGPRGTGKTSTAKVFSKAINCIEHIDGSPCEKCEFCLNFVENPDIIEIDAASNNGVDEIRGLIDNIKLTPTNGKYKVYIIDEVHMLTTSAFNALLLTLEEPPAHAIFILATTNIEEALTEIAYLSEGGMRDALSLLDQLSKNGQNISLDLVEKQIKTISQKGINELIETIEKNDVENCLRLINEYRIRAIDYKTLIKKVIDICSFRAKNIKKTGRIVRLDFKDYKDLIINLSDCLTKININVEPYTIIEMILLEFFNVETNNTESITMIKEENNKKIETNVQQTKVFEGEIDNDFINIRINNTFVNAQKVFLEEAKNVIDSCNNSVSIDGKIKSILIDSNVVVASDEYVILTCISDHAADNANKLLNEIEKSIKDSLNKKYKLVFISEERWQKEKSVPILVYRLSQ